MGGVADFSAGGDIAGDAGLGDIGSQASTAPTPGGDGTLGDYSALAPGADSGAASALAPGGDAAIGMAPLGDASGLQTGGPGMEDGYGWSPTTADTGTSGGAGSTGDSGGSGPESQLGNVNNSTDRSNFGGGGKGAADGSAYSSNSAQGNIYTDPAAKGNYNDAGSNATGSGNANQASNLVNQLARALKGSGGATPQQLSQLLSRMGTPNSGGLTFGQRAQLRLMRRSATAAAQQRLWNAGVTNPKADSRYTSMVMNINQQLAAQAQQMISQNFQQALAGNQQLMQLAQMQLNQQNQEGNVAQSLMQAIGQGAGRSAGSGSTYSEPNTRINATSG